MKNILIVDGLNLFIRHFVVVPTMDANGVPIGGLSGFLKSLKNLTREVAPDRVYVIWDGEGGSRRRRGIFAEYKAGRKVRLNREFDVEKPDEDRDNMHSQLKRLHDLLEMLGVIQVEVPEIEADDGIAFLCRFLFSDIDKVIVSSDRDMLQLVDDRTIIYSPSKKVYWTVSEMREKMNILPENYIYMKALMGDTSDNIPGLGGIGEKTALKLFPFLSERLVSGSDEILQYAETNKNLSPKYKGVVEQRERFLENVRLMQLSNPIFSAQAASHIRSQVHVEPRFTPIEAQLRFIRAGLTSIDQDFMSTFRALHFRMGHTV